MNTQLEQAFDYSGCDAEIVAFGQETAQLARTYMQFRRRTVEKGLDLGERLLKMKENLLHGRYMPYLDSIGVPYADAYYWTRKVRESIEGQILDIQDLIEPQEPETFPYATNTEEATTAYHGSIADELLSDLDKDENYVVDAVQPDNQDTQNPPVEEDAEDNQTTQEDEPEIVDDKPPVRKPSKGGGIPAIVTSIQVENTGDFQTYLVKIKRPDQDFPFRFRIPFEMSVEVAKQVLWLEDRRLENTTSP
jgi:hypothetical protein